MTISPTIVWLIVTLIIFGAEMLMGTIFLIALGAGTLAAGLLALFGVSLTAQFTVAGIITIAGAVAAFYIRRRMRRCGKNLDNLDVGQRVEVREVGQDGCAVVTYRGAKWTAMAENGDLSPGTWEIRRTEGPRLILGRRISNG